MTDANDMLMGGGIKSAKFPVVGTTVVGTIAFPPEVQNQRDIKTGDPKTYSDGNPMQQIRVVLDTLERDPEDPFDEGQRAVYLKSKMLAAVRMAIRTVGAPGLEVGGTLTVTYSDDAPVTQAGFNPPKVYTATYAAPSAVDANTMLMGGAQPAPQTPPPQAPAAAPAPQPAAAPPVPQAPAPAPAPAAPAPGGSPEAAAAIAQLTPEQRAALGL